MHQANATFTINLLYSVVGLGLGADYFNILQSPLNGVELVNYFNNAFQVEREDVSAALERSDV